MKRIGLAVLFAAAVPFGAYAQEAKPPAVSVDAYDGVPVFAGDITDRPYRVIGDVSAGVRKATIFSKSASEQKVYRELWERARKMGADAVIHASYGRSHVTAISWGKTNATGTAVKFTDGAAK
nr:heavy metal-binding domain-containing protein [Sphingomonas liriopis]